MSSGRHKMYLSAERHLDDDCRQNLQNNPVLKEKFQFLYNKFDLKEQIPLLKKTCCIKGDNLEEHDKMPKDTLTILVNIYLNCSSKHTVKRILASTFQNYGSAVQKLIKPIITEQVQSKEKASLQSRNLGDIRHCVDTVNGLMENFTLGEDCLKMISLPVLEFLSSALDIFIQTRSPDMSPVQHNEIMHHCLTSVQSTNRLIQKCMKEVVDASQSDDRNVKLEAVSQNILKSCINLLKTENFLLDCETSCGMSIVLLLKLNHKASIVPLILKIMMVTMATKDEQPDWLREIDLTDLHSLTFISKLCLYYGLLAQLDVTDLTYRLTNEKFLLLDIFLDTILRLSKCCVDTSSKLLASRFVLLWTSKAWSCLKTQNLSESFVIKFRGSSPMMQEVLEFVWATWEDTVDVIRFTAKDIFENVIKVDSLAVKYRNFDQSENRFILNMAKLLFDISWTCKGKFGALSILTEHIGSYELLKICPSLPSEVLAQMKEQTMACYGSELYHKLSSMHRQELTTGQNVMVSGAITKEKGLKSGKSKSPVQNKSLAVSGQWLDLWVRPVVATLTEADKHHKTQIIEYVLPKLLKTGMDTLHYMIKLLSSPTSNQVGALITCLRRARVMGLLKTPSTESRSSECLYGVVSGKLVRQALCHVEEQVRLDAFALLCENHKTSEPIAEFEFHLLKYFLLWNLNNQLPSFRQHLLAHAKKLFMRYQESERALRRQLQTNSSKQSTITEHLVCYKNFLSWLFNLLIQSLYPGSAFARRTTSLSLLSLMVDIFGTAQDSVFSLKSHMKSCHLQTLMECLTDTFEENKMEAYKILQYNFSQGLHLQAQIQMTNSELFEISMELAGSTRPQDCTTAAYMFRVLLLQPNIYTCFLEDDTILEKFLSAEQMKSWRKLINDDSRLKIVTTKYANKTGSVLMLLWILLLYLQDQTLVAKTTLFLAAAKRPMYPTLHCIRYILFDTQLRELAQEEVIHWKVFVENLISICLEISEIVSPVVQNSSPEGNIPTDTLEDFQSILKSHDSDQQIEAEKSMERVMLMPEYLVVCCWRNVKEVSLLLGLLTMEASIEDPDVDDQALLSVQQIGVIGNYFIKQLLESIHRGAFELACAGFVKQCQMLWRSKIRALHQLPKLWLDQVMTDVKTDDVNNKLCATRRSAGIPFYVQTLITTEPACTGRPCFNSVMVDLLKLAQQEDKEANVMSNSKVHALNILRALYRDTRLGEVVTPYIADGLQVAILGFHSPFWAVRNSATLLLSAMFVRIFGAKRNKDESNMSKKNCQTGRQFFHQFPSLYKFLLDQLSKWTDNMGDTSKLLLHPGLYPVLMVLGRLFHSPLEGADTSLSLTAFIPYIIRCNSSPVMKTRLMAARALQPLVQKDQLTSILVELLSLIPDSDNGRQRHTHIHGILLQVYALLDLLSTQSDDIVSHCKVVILSTWNRKLWLISRNNCFVTKSQALEVTQKILELFKCGPQECSVESRENISKTFMAALSEMYSQNTYKDEELAHIPGFIESVTRMCRLYISYLVQNTSGSSELVKKLLNLLSSGFYDVRIVVLEELKGIFANNMIQCHFDKDATLSRSEKGPHITGAVSILLKKLITMALYEENHFLCQIKEFEILSQSNLMMNAPWKDFEPVLSTCQILEHCLKIMETTRRDEVKASVLQFTRWLIPDVAYHLSQPEKRVQIEVVFRDWIGILKENIKTEQSPDLQLSVAMVMEHNAEILLKDSLVIGDLIFEFWDIMVNLQQEDDLDVKNVVAIVMTKLDDTLETVHPSLTLDWLICKMVDLHGNKCLPVLLKWLTHDTNIIHEDGERLFDRSEMNIFREETIFTQIVVKNILKLVGFSNNTAMSDFNSMDWRETVTSQLHLVQDLSVSKSNEEQICPNDVRCDEGQLVLDVSNYLKSQTDVLVEYEKYFSGCSPLTWKSPFFMSSAYQENLLKIYKISFLVKIVKTFCHREEINKTLGNVNAKVQQHLKHGNIALNTFLFTLSELSI